MTSHVVVITVLLLPLGAVAATLRGDARRRALLIDAWLVLAMISVAVWAAAARLRPVPELLVSASLFIRMAGWLAVAHYAMPDQLRWRPVMIGLIALTLHGVHLPRILQVPIDGDEPYYVLTAESLLDDGDLDLRNQYAALERSVTGRTDLVPQQGDPVIASGAQRSRHEPFFAMLLVPGLALGGLAGASLTVVLFAALLGWSITALLRELGLPSGAVVAGSALVLMTAPLVSYSVRIWPEVPAALCLSEGMRWILRRRLVPASVWLIAMSLLKLRFAVIAAPLLLLTALWHLDRKQRVRAVLFAFVAMVLPMAIIWLVSGSPLNVHRTSEFLLLTPLAIARGGFGMLLDGQSGLLFVAPIVFFCLLAHLRPSAAAGARELRLLALASLPYLILLAPRAEWYGGWSPPLRYLVVFAPLAAMVVARAHAAGLDQWKALAWLLSFASAIYAVVLPWRQFHIATGESHLGAVLSRSLGADASRLFPSFIRLNHAATAAAVGLVLLVACLLLTRQRPLPRRGAVPLFVLAAACLGLQARVPARVVHFEDVHVQKNGGELEPPPYTQARFLYEGGWRIEAGDEVRFRAGGDAGRLRVRSAAGGSFELDGQQMKVDAGEHWRDIEVRLDPLRQQHVIRVTSGSLVLESLHAR